MVNVRELKAYSLSNFDINKALEPGVPVHTYPDLDDMLSIDEALDRKGRGILLVLTENKSVGHWVSILKRGNNIEVFDSYGFNPNEHNNKLEVSDEVESIQDDSTLGNLIKKSGYGMVYNKMKHQSLNPDVATCGRHAVMRLVFKDYGLDEYNKIMKQIKKETGVSTDDLATAFTHELIGK